MKFRRDIKCEIGPRVEMIPGAMGGALACRGGLSLNGARPG